MSESSDLPQATSTTSEADADHQGGSASPDDQTIAGIGDDKLPDDLQPGEDNPLAEPLDPDAEETKDTDELGMQDTQDDTTGDYRTEGELGDADATTADSESDGEDEETGSSKGDGAQGAGITG